MSVLSSIGVARVVNGVGPATRFGGVHLHPDVLAAMREATTTPVRMDELQEKAGRRIAELLGVEAAYVTSGASAALTLATAVAIAHDDAAHADSLPCGDALRNGVVVQAAHRDPYDRAVEAAGGRLVVVGYPSSTHLGEVERVLDDAAAVLFRPGRNGNLVTLEEVAHLAHRRGLPVIVDGALHAPPAAALRGFFEAGADLVAISGGKQFRGPQASGVLCGRRELIDMVALHHQDMDERSVTWRRNVGASATGTPPRHGVARGMKVGREQICGLLAAIERYIDSPGRDDLPGIDELHQLAGAIDRDIFHVDWVGTNPLGVPELHVEAPASDTDSLLRHLAAQSPPIYVEESEVWRGIIIVNPMALLPGDGVLLANGLAEAVQAATADRTEESIPTRGARA